MRWLADEEEQLQAKGLPGIDFLIVDMSRKETQFSSAQNNMLKLSYMI